MQGIVCRAVDAGVLLWLAGLDVLDGNPMTRRPFLQLFTDVSRAVVDPHSAGLAAPFDDAVKAPDHTLCGQGKVDLNRQTFSIEVVQHVQQPERPAILPGSGLHANHARAPIGRP